MQRFSFAAALPLYLAIHLLTSPTTVPTANNLAIISSDAASIPWSLALGYIIPTLALAMPAPNLISYDMKQWVNAIWQVFPLWVGAAHQLLKRVVPASSGPGAYRAAYLFMIYLSGVTHIVSLATTIFPPRSFGPVTFRSTFIPKSFFPSTKVTSLGEGAHQFLLYDEIIGSTALLIWTVFLDARDGGYLASGLKALGWTALLGPSGAAAALMMKRDERVLGRKRE